MSVLGKVRERLTYANVISTLALFLVLGGGSAVALSGHNTVFSDDIVDKTITGKDLAKNSIRSPKIKDAGVKSRDLNLMRTRASGGPLATNDDIVSQNLPLSGGSWSQAAGEVELLTGTMTATRPQTCSTDGTHHGEVVVDIDVSGTGLPFTQTPRGTGTAGFSDVNIGATGTVPIIFDPIVIAGPAVAKTPSLFARIHDRCTGAGQNWIVQSVKVNVAGLR